MPVLLFRRLRVLELGFRRLVPAACLVEALVMDHADLEYAVGTSQCIIRIAQSQTALVGSLGGVQIADAGKVFVGVAAVVVVIAQARRGVHGGEKNGAFHAHYLTNVGAVDVFGDLVAGGGGLGSEKKRRVSRNLLD